MPTFSIAELVSLTGVPPATVHYYLRSGLLPRPKRAAPNRFTYDDRHVQGLKLIRTLRKRRGLSLPMIKRILPELMHLETTEAFLPEMWDRALAPSLSRRSRTPSSRLLEAAKEAFARRGYDAVNVDEICQAARISKGAFYRHYHSKEDLFFAATESAASEMIEEFRRSVGEVKLDPEAAGEALSHVMESRLPLFLDLFGKALQRRPGYPAAARKIFSHTATELGLSIAGDAPPQELGARAVGAGVLSAFRRIQDLPQPHDTAAEPAPPAVAESASLPA